MGDSGDETSAAAKAASGIPARNGIDAARLWATLDETARFGGAPHGGLHRLALGAADGRVRAWFEEAASASGFAVQRDEIGNQFVVKPGTHADAAPVLVGSHLDSQPFGGRYDGAYGVLTGLEVLRALNEHGISHERSIILANWTNEEGARFSPSMMGSAVFSGALPLADALARVDTDGTSVAEALAGIAAVTAATPAPPRVDDFHAAVEIHIEQGPSLEDSGIDIGFVTGVQAIRWLDLTVIGRGGHAGTTPLGARKDALVAAARLIDTVSRLGETVDPDIRPTVGEIIVSPNSRNVIPAEARLAIDIRHPQESVLDVAEQRVRAAAARVAADSGTAISVEVVLDQPAVSFDSDVLASIRAATAALGLAGSGMVSRAGHDAMQLSARVPTAMIFIPCVGGISHAEDEDITPAWAENGARVLFDVVARLSGATT